MFDRRSFIIGLLISMPLVLLLILPTRQQLLAPSNMLSIRILDRNGIILREVLSCEDATSRYCELRRISPWLIKATLASEDKRFFLHKGIDPLAIIRSALLNIMYNNIIAGGSTITQQLARNLINSPSRSIMYKLIEVYVAINLELKLNKSEILELYLNCAPYSNQTYGIAAAAHLYFRKPASDLSVAEAAFLAGLPKAPSYFNPYQYPQRLEQEKNMIMELMLENNIIDAQQYENARKQPLKLIAKEQNFLAPHFCQAVLDQIQKAPMKNYSTIITTLDSYLQNAVEAILKSNLERLKNAHVTNCAILVLDNHTMEILAYVGSADFFDPMIAGEVDGIQALRQPGSALKPFTYALALENGCTAATLIPDLPTYEKTSGGDYTPRNYDEKYHGMVRLRTALACSYNIPAVRVCREFGTEMLLARLRKAGFKSLDNSPIHYGLGLTLGNGEVTLLELTRSYSVFAHYGRLRQEQSIISIDTMVYNYARKTTKVFEPEHAYIIMDILSDNNARSPAFGLYSPLNLPFFCSAKTGTSKDFRDNWCIGFTDKYLIGVWVGNFDGSSMHHVSGITGAGPIFRDIILLLHRETPAIKYAKPARILTQNICALSGELAGPFCENTILEMFYRGTEPVKICHYHTDKETLLCDLSAYHTSKKDSVHPIAIVFPDDGDIFKIDPILRSEHQCLTLRLKTSYPLSQVSWFIDDSCIGSAGLPYTIIWQLEPGVHQVKALGLTNDNTTLSAAPVNVLVLE